MSTPPASAARSAMIYEFDERDRHPARARQGVRARHRSRHIDSGLPDRSSRSTRPSCPRRVRRARAPPGRGPRRAHGRDRQPQRLSRRDAAGAAADPAAARAAVLSEPAGRGDLPDQPAAGPGRRHGDATSTSPTSPMRCCCCASSRRRGASARRSRCSRTAAAPHEDAIREFRIDGGGVRVGEPLSAFKGVLTGTPEYTGERGRR